MASPSAIAAARAAPDAAVRTALMARTMAGFRESHGACTADQLTAEGFIAAEIAAYHDDAVAICTGRPQAAEVTPATAAARAEALALVERGRLIRARGQWAPPRVTEERVP